MAEKILNTRIQLKYDSYNNWYNSSIILKDGEMAVAYIDAAPSEVKDTEQALPHILLKVGNNKDVYKDLPFVSGLAADVYSWAKASTKPTYGADEITGIDAYISEYVNEQMGISVDTDTQYKLVKVDDYNFKLQSKGKTDSAWADVSGSTIAIPNDTSAIETLQGLVGDTAVNTQIANAIANLYLDTTYAPIEHGHTLDEVTGAAVTITSDTTTAGALKSYTVKQGDTTIGVIDIPKDMVVQSGEVVTNPEGHAEGTYIKLVLANATNDEIYVNVGNLVDIYKAKESATQIQIAIDPSTREISATVVAGSIGSTELADDAVVTAKIADGNITKAKLSTELQTSIDKAHDHDNKDLLDTYTQTEADLADAVSKKHSHNNKDVLDEITEEKVAAWDEIGNKANSADLANIAKTGNVNDLIQTTGDVLVFNCGTASTVI